MTDKKLAEDGEQVAVDMALADSQTPGRVSFLETIDATPLTGVKRHKDGYIAGRVKAARTGIQTYTGAEMGWPDMETVRVYRPVEEVMRLDSLASYKGKPVTDSHPNERVTADNWETYSRGTVMGVQRSGDTVQVDLVVSSKSLIDKLEIGAARQLSAGYTAQVERVDGVAPSGERYDAIQRDIYIDHIAVVPAGRAGSEFRVGDGADVWGAAPIEDHKKSKHKETKMSDALKTVVLGDKAAQVAVGDVQIIEAFKDAQKRALEDAATAHADAISVKDKEIAKKDARIADLEKQVLTDEQKAKLVADRVELETTVGKITDKVGTKGLTDSALKKAVVVEMLGADAVTDKSDAYIDARFDILAEDAAKVDPVADAIKGGLDKSYGHSNVADKAYLDSVREMETAYLGEPAVKKEA